jgi:hypothetical protein
METLAQQGFFIFRPNLAVALMIFFTFSVLRKKKMATLFITLTFLFCTGEQSVFPYLPVTKNLMVSSAFLPFNRIK